MKRFRTSPAAGRMSNRILVYRTDEYSFDVRPAASDAFTSVLLNDLNLELDSNGKIVSVWGMCPHTRWKVSTLTPPSAAFGEVFFVPDTPLVRGVSVRMSDNNYWPVLVDPSNGWVCVKGEGLAASAVEILPGVIIEVAKQGDLAALWLKPDLLPRVKTADSRMGDLG